jgi:hypothetical protein
MLHVAHEVDSPSIPRSFHADLKRRGVTIVSVINEAFDTIWSTAA